MVITRLTAYIMSGLMSDLGIYKFRKCMVIHDTEYPYWDQVSLIITKDLSLPQKHPNKQTKQQQQQLYNELCWLFQEVSGTILRWEAKMMT